MSSIATAAAVAFVGRDAELTALAAALDELSAGRGGLVLVAGEPGIGKTRLLEEAAALAGGRGGQVLWGRCHEGEGAPAFWPWVQTIRAYLAGADVDAVRAALGPAAADVAQFVPDVRTVLQDVAKLPPLEPVQARFRLFESVTAFLSRAAAARPLVLLLDDLHWADVPSLLLLEFLARYLASAAVLVVGTYRQEEVVSGGPLSRVLGELVRHPHVLRLTLTGMSVEAVRQVIVQMSAQAETTGGAGPLVDTERDALAAFVHHETEGNPLFVRELVRLMAAEGRLAAPASPIRRIGVPPTVREVIGLRLARLSVDCQRTLGVAAVIGREFDVNVLGRVAEFAGGPLLDVLEEAEAAQIITAATSVPGRYRFSHALIRETLYENLPTTRRVRLHQQVGTALETVYRGDIEPYLAQLAWHFAEAAPIGDTDRAVGYAEQAAVWATRMHAYEEAARHYALVMPFVTDPARRGDLLLAQGEAQARGGDMAGAQKTFTDVAALARRLRNEYGSKGSDTLLARAALAFEAITPVEAVSEAATHLLEEALDGLGGDNPLKVAVLSRLSLALYFATSRRRRDSLSREAVAMARRLGDPDLLSRALFDRHFALWGPDNLADRAAAARAYQRRAADGGRPERVLEAYRLLIPALLEQGDIAAANDAITAHARLAEDLRLPEHRWRAAVWASTLALMNGAFAEAEERIGRALAIGQQAEQSNATLFFGTQLYALRAEQGRLAEIEAPARVAAQANTWLPSQRAALAHLCCDLGHREEARREFDRLASGKPGEHGPSGRQRDDFAHLARDASWLLCMSLVAEVCAMLADGGRAATLYRILLPYAAHCVVPGGGIVWSGSVERRLGLLAATLGRWNETAGHFEREIALCTRVRARPALAHAQYDYAAMLIMAAQHEDDGRHADERSRDVHQARGLLAEALATARELGMNRLVAAAEALAASLSTSRPSTRPSFPDGLTAREVEVLRLLAVGRTNSEIAAQLVLSVRTVERHIETIYEKIGAHGRAARAVAASYAHGHGLMVD